MLARAWRGAAPLPDASPIEPYEPRLWKASTDVGDVSWQVPTLHLSVTTAPIGAPWHAWPVVATGGMSIGHKGMLYAAKTTDTSLLRLDFGIFALHFVLMCLFLVLPLELTDILQMDSAEHWKVYLPVLVASLVIMVPFIIIAEKKHKMKPVFNGAIAALLLATLWFAVITTETPHDALAYQFIGALVLFFASFNLLEASLPSLISS